MMRDLVLAVLAANLAAALAVLAVLPLRRLVRPRLGARAAYALWIAPPLAALAVLIPHRAASQAAVAPFVVEAGKAAARALPSAPAQDLLAVALVGLWLAGALATGLLLARRQSAFMRSLGSLTPASGDRRLVHASRSGVGPALVGALRPRIVTPADFETRYQAEERALILAHEETHLAAGDGLVNAVACAAQCLGWFNPLVHLGVQRLRIDQELACDAAVIGRFPEARQLYGALLLKTQLATDALPLGCHWPAKGAHPLKERIAMLKSPLPALAERRAGLAVAALVGLAAASWAWAASARAPHVITQPDWADKPTSADLVKDYPPDAVKAHVEGRATIACDVAATGALARCKVISEAPAGAGFGEASLKLSERFRMKPMSKDGHPVAGGKVRIPIRFMLPTPPAPPKA
jgi:TonB family protein